MGHAARDFDALGVNPAILLGKQRRDNRADVIGRHVHLDTSQIQFHFHSRPFSYLLRIRKPSLISLIIWALVGFWRVGQSCPAAFSPWALNRQQ